MNETSQESRRTSMRNTTDDRVTSTRGTLVSAYRFAAEQQVSNLSVTWLCTHAQVGRSTFYTHFASVDELAIAAITADFGSISDQDISHRRSSSADRRRIARDGLLALIHSLDASRSLVDYAVRVGSHADVLAGLIATFVEHIHATVALEYSSRSPEHKALIEEYVGAGTAHVLLSWLNDPSPLAPDELVDWLVDLLPQLLTN